VPLPLKRIVAPPEGVLTDEEILRKILSEIRRMRARKRLEKS
jgi:hypothetical protein